MTTLRFCALFSSVFYILTPQSDTLQLRFALCALRHGKIEEAERWQRRFKLNLFAAGWADRKSIGRFSKALASPDCIRQLLFMTRPRSWGQFAK